MYWNLTKDLCLFHLPLTTGISEVWQKASSIKESASILGIMNKKENLSFPGHFDILIAVEFKGHYLYPGMRILRGRHSHIQHHILLDTKGRSPSLLFLTANTEFCICEGRPRSRKL